MQGCHKGQLRSTKVPAPWEALWTGRTAAVCGQDIFIPAVFGEQ